MSEIRDARSECYNCKNRKSIPGDAHSKCEKPDPNMKGKQRAIDMGWFSYPYNFDPVWKEKMCANWEAK